MVMGLKEDNVSDERSQRCIQWLADYNASLNKAERVPTGEDYNTLLDGVTAILASGWEPEPIDEPRLKRFHFEVTEARHVRRIYTVEATNVSEARDMAENGDTIREEDVSSLYDVVERVVFELVGESE